MFMLGFFGGVFLWAAFFFFNINISMRLKKLRNRDIKIVCSLLFRRDYSFFFFSFLHWCWVWGTAHTEVTYLLRWITEQCVCGQPGYKSLYVMMQVSLDWIWFPVITYVHTKGKQTFLPCSSSAGQYRISTLGTLSLLFMNEN